MRKEFAHPIIGSLFGTVFISLLLLPIIIAPVSLSAARALWVLGAAGIPHALERRVRLADTAVGRALSGWLNPVTSRPRHGPAAQAQPTMPAPRMRTSISLGKWFLRLLRV